MDTKELLAFATRRLADLDLVFRHPAQAVGSLLRSPTAQVRQTVRPLAHDHRWRRYGTARGGFILRPRGFAGLSIAIRIQRVGHSGQCRQPGCRLFSLRFHGVGTGLGFLDAERQQRRRHEFAVDEGLPPVRVPGRSSEVIDEPKKTFAESPAKRATPADRCPSCWCTPSGTRCCRSRLAGCLRPTNRHLMDAAARPVRGGHP